MSETRYPAPVGATFGHLRVVGKAETLNGRGRWRCICVCGNETVASAANVKSGSIKSCGCRQYIDNRTTTHGLGKSRTYRIWGLMKSRCTNSKMPNYSRYGGRGISVCARWMDSFESFLADMGEAPAGLTIERIDNDGNYEPGNCRWATRKEQCLNKSTNRLETVFGETKPLVEWMRDPRCKVKPGTVGSRLAYGWPIERALTEPSKGWPPARLARLQQRNVDRLRATADEESGA